jgi:hypothetical protein
MREDREILDGIICFRECTLDEWVAKLPHEDHTAAKELAKLRKIEREYNRMIEIMAADLAQT